MIFYCFQNIIGYDSPSITETQTRTMPSFETVFRELGVHPEIQYNILEYSRASSLPENLKSSIECVGTYKRIARCLQKDNEDWNKACVEFNARVAELRETMTLYDSVCTAEWEFHPRFDQVRFQFKDRLHERLGFVEDENNAELLHMLKKLSRFVSCPDTMNKVSASSPQVEIYQKTPQDTHEYNEIYKKNTFKKTPDNIIIDLADFVWNLRARYPGLFADLTKEEDESFYKNIDLVMQEKYNDAYVDLNDYYDDYDSEGDDEDYDF